MDASVLLLHNKASANIDAHRRQRVCVCVCVCVLCVLYVCMYVGMYIRMYAVRMYVRMYVTHTHTQTIYIGAVGRGCRRP